QQLARPVTEILVDPVVEEARPLLVIVGGLVERRVLAPEVDAEPDAEDEAPTAQVVKRHRLPSDLVRAAARQRRDHRAESNALGRAGNRRARDPCVRQRDGPLVSDVVPREEAVPPGRLGAHRQLHQEVDVAERGERRHINAPLHFRITTKLSAWCWSSTNRSLLLSGTGGGYD